MAIVENAIMSTQTLAFRPRQQAADLAVIISTSADLLARTIVRMVTEGAERGLRETLLNVNPAAARNATEEAAVLYAFVADRSANAFLERDFIPEDFRTAFQLRMLDEVPALLSKEWGDLPEEADLSRARFLELWSSRRFNYSSCERMYRQESEGLEGTVIYAFYRNLLALGHETALHVLANIQIPLLHVEISRTFGELICEALGMEV